ncbi:MAG: DUF1080 domain-containing protein [Acidobacteria bacterium]|nr:DUF1080 domain-containing protein [Acidobacteriota bacterium]
MRTGILLLLLLSPAALPAADWADLLGGSLKQWDVLGDGVWKLRSDGVLVAYRKPDKEKLFAASPTIDKKQFHQWDIVQSWLYTKKDYDEFDLHLDYWVRTPGNSGISIRDPSHAKYGMTHPPDFSKTPSKLGYEIQINSQWPDPWPTGSIYGLAKAKEGVQKEGEWNSLNVVSRREGIKVYVNGELVAEHAGDPKRPLSGPIGLQLHDQTSFVMFRNIFVLEH